MEIGQKVKWLGTHGKECKGIFRNIENNKAIVICYWSGIVACHLKVKVEVGLLEIDEIKD